MLSQRSTSGAGNHAHIDFTSYLPRSVNCRYASAIIMILYLVLTMAILLWATYTRPTRVARRPALFLVALSALLVRCNVISLP